jgi:uncharacterized protein
MNARAQMQMLPDCRRLHLQDGPIDLIIEAFGSEPEIVNAYHAACARFVTVLDELCAELPFLRRPCSPETNWPHGKVARRMVAAVLPYASQYFITPMAAVAGAVAEEILAVMVSAGELSRAYVNDGGDIALHMGETEQFAVGMIDRPDRPLLFGTTTLRPDDPVRGIATSGWRGRSFSLGIADAVTVLADRAAPADAAATMIANAVDLPAHPAIARVPACELAPDSDLEFRLVTQNVAHLGLDEIHQALASGASTAERLLRMGLIRAAALHLQGETRTVGEIARSTLPSRSTPERMLVHG